MKLPNAEIALVDPRKLKDYVLSPVHSVGRFKAAYFTRLGFTTANWESLGAELRRLALQDNAEPSKRTVFGQKYVIRGSITSPAGLSAEVLTVWIVLNEERVARFVTMYPED